METGPEIGDDAFLGGRPRRGLPSGLMLTMCLPAVFGPLVTPAPAFDPTLPLPLGTALWWLVPDPEPDPEPGLLGVFLGLVVLLLLLFLFPTLDPGFGPGLLPLLAGLGPGFPAGAALFPGFGFGPGLPGVAPLFAGLPAGGNRHQHPIAKHQSVSHTHPIRTDTK